MSLLFDVILAAGGMVAIFDMCVWLGVVSSLLECKLGVALLCWCRLLV